MPWKGFVVMVVNTHPTDGLSRTLTLTATESLCCGAPPNETFLGSGVFYTSTLLHDTALPEPKHNPES